MTAAARCEADLVLAVDRFFDRLQNALPVYVRRGPSFALALAVALVLSVAARMRLRPRLRAARAAGDAEELARQSSFAVAASVAILAIAVATQRLVYYLQMFAANRQHFTNLMWLPLYSKAVRALPRLAERPRQGKFD